MKVRLSPSGPVLFETGIGARLRLAESQSTMGGSLAVPTAQSAICTDGFGGAQPIVVSLANPKENLYYRADLRLDLFNVSSSHNCVVCLYLESSVDAGATWTTRSKNAHVIQPALGVGSEDNGQAREASLAVVMTLGESFGVVDGTTASIRFRASARLTTGTATDVEVSSLASASPETGLAGTIHLQLEECTAA